MHACTQACRESRAKERDNTKSKSRTFAVGEKCKARFLPSPVLKETSFDVSRFSADGTVICALNCNSPSQDTTGNMKVTKGNICLWHYTGDMLAVGTSPDPPRSGQPEVYLRWYSCVYVSAGDKLCPLSEVKAGDLPDRLMELAGHCDNHPVWCGHASPLHPQHHLLWPRSCCPLHQPGQLFLQNPPHLLSQQGAGA